jgi:hypothetical protein
MEQTTAEDPDIPHPHSGAQIGLGIPESVDLSQYLHLQPTCAKPRESLQEEALGEGGGGIGGVGPGWVNTGTRLIHNQRASQ